VNALVPKNRLLEHQPLHAASGRTEFNPDTLLLTFQPGYKRQLEDSGFITTIHEGVHWRQLHGTTFGAFYSWLKHSQEANCFDHLARLPSAVRDRLLEGRASSEGTPILALDSETSLPAPPLTGTSLRDPVNLLRMVWFDHVIVRRFFYLSSAVERYADPLEQIFPSVVADAASALATYHPEWASREYDSLQETYQLRDRVGAVDAGGGRHLTTQDLLESAASTNELFLSATTREIRYGAPDAPDDEPVSVWYPGSQPGEFGARSEEVLKSPYGLAGRIFFRLTGFEPRTIQSWTALLAALDFALNPPLPPVVPPLQAPMDWGSLYPPARFLKLCGAAKALRLPPRHPTHDTLNEYLAGLAERTRFPNPTNFQPPRPRADFFAIVRDNAEAEELWSGKLSYYDFVLWCQASMWQLRRSDLVVAIAPALTIEELLWENHKKLFRTLSSLAMTPPAICSGGNQLSHSAGSSVKFGTWLALSTLAHDFNRDLMAGVGPPNFDDYPISLIQYPNSLPFVRAGLRKAIGSEPWPDNG
jgi:hypothetical protein